MQVRQCYEKMGGDYRDVMERFSESEDLIEHFLIGFLEDDSQDNLRAALKEGNVEDAFRASHTLKGLAGNLGMKSLAAAAVQTTERLRGGEFPEKEQMEALEREYARTIGAIHEMMEESGSAVPGDVK